MTETKTFTLKEVKGHDDSKSTFLVIYDKVYDVTKFLEEVRMYFTYCWCHRVRVGVSVGGV
jgi:hypothetical protein